MLQTLRALSSAGITYVLRCPANAVSTLKLGAKIADVVPNAVATGNQVAKIARTLKLGFKIAGGVCILSWAQQACSHLQKCWDMAGSMAESAPAFLQRTQCLVSSWAQSAWSLLEKNWMQNAGAQAVQAQMETAKESIVSTFSGNRGTKLSLRPELVGISLLLTLGFAAAWRHRHSQQRKASWKLVMLRWLRK
ncbi:unnamed protein product [Symbiodinium sp. CCMP2592]|nr:unnamed protein product [Symbiodinium sp. CCMP2592]